MSTPNFFQVFYSKSGILNARFQCLYSPLPYVIEGVNPFKPTHDFTLVKAALEIAQLTDQDYKIVLPNGLSILVMQSPITHGVLTQLATLYEVGAPITKSLSRLMRQQLKHFKLRVEGHFARHGIPPPPSHILHTN